MNFFKRFLLLTILCFNFFVLHSQSLLFAAKEKGKKYGYINELGDYTIAPKFEDAGGFKNGIAVVKHNKKFGIINTKGEFLVSPQYDRAITYAPEGKVSVKKGGKWGVIDSSGKIIIPFVHEYISVFVNGYVVVGKYIPEKGYKMRICPTVLNEKNEILFQVEQNEDTESSLSAHFCTELFLPGFADKKTNYYSNGWPIVRENKLVLSESWEGGPEYTNIMVVDIDKKKSISFQFGLALADNYFGYRENSLAVEVPDESRDELGDMALSGFYDTTNFDSGYPDVPIFNLDVQKVHPFFNGVAAAEKDGRWIFIDRNGLIVGETQLSTSVYDATPPMHFNGLIAFWKNGKAGYVDLTGKEVIPFTLDEFHPFEQDITPVKQNGLYGLIRKDGTWAVPPKFEELLLSPCPCYK